MQAIDFIKGTKDTFPKMSLDKLPKDAHILQMISVDKINVDIDRLQSFLLSNTLKGLEKSFLSRILLTYILIKATEENTTVDIKNIWKIIYDGLNDLESHDIQSSIGSQGFIAIPLFRIEKSDEEFYLLRLHIWNNEIDKIVNTEAKNNLRIHTHQFHANSWIICGEVYNTRFIVKEVSEATPFTLFNIKYNNTDKSSLKKTSTAVNSYSYVKITEKPVEIYKSGDTYEIEADKFHMSDVNRDFDITSTIFLFSSQKSRTMISKVLGPSNLSESKVNRIEKIDPLPFINKINETIQQ